MEELFLQEYQPLVFAQLKKVSSMGALLMLIFLKGTRGLASMN